MSSIRETHYFPNASNAVFSNFTITNVNETTYTGYSEGLKLLLNNISKGAFHDAAERGDPPKCHPHTRVAIREEIMEWIKAPVARQKFVIWMYGPAGSGKTAIAQSIAEECKKKGLLAASFFFSRLATGRNDTTRLVATIAYQISRFLPQIENDLFTAIEKDPAIFSRTLATQMQVLVVEPLKGLPTSLRKPILVVLDGVDEIGPNPQSQATLLDAIRIAISELQHVPLIVLIASRPEYEIREAFDKPPLHSFMRPLVLDNHYNPDADIKLYFNTMFRQVHDRHLRLGTHLPSPWPSKGDVKRLVSKASGQFIFASTVMKFVDSVRLNPAQQLDIIMGLSAAGNATPFALLDALYRHIFSSVADLPQVLEILTLLLLSRDTEYVDLTVRVIDKLLDIDVCRVLIDMHALVFVPLPTDRDSTVRIHHASLYDFLVDRSRSCEYYIDEIQGHITLSRHWLEFIGHNTALSRTSLRHSVSTFIYHSQRSPFSREIADDLVYFSLRLALEEMPARFVGNRLLVTEWSEFFDCVKKQVITKIPWWKVFVRIRQQFGDRAGIVARLQRELFAFIIDCISKYPQQIREFIPAILTLPHANIIFFKLAGAVDSSSTDFYKTRYYDSELLDISNSPYCNYIFSRLFKNHSFAGRYYVHSGSYLTLAKKIVSAIFPKLPERGQKVQLRNTPTSQLRSTNPNRKNWFGRLLSEVPKDLDLAQLLLDRALQYSGPYPGGRPYQYGKSYLKYGEVDDAALASLIYVEMFYMVRNVVCPICSIFTPQAPRNASYAPITVKITSQSPQGGDHPPSRESERKCGASSLSEFTV